MQRWSADGRLVDAYMTSDDLLDTVSTDVDFEPLPEEDKGRLFHESVMLAPFEDA